MLLLGDDLRAFLAIARSLGRRGVEVHAAPSDFSSSALKSRYIAAGCAAYAVDLMNKMQQITANLIKAGVLKADQPKPPANLA